MDVWHLLNGVAVRDGDRGRVASVRYSRRARDWVDIHAWMTRALEKNYYLVQDRVFLEETRDLWASMKSGPDADWVFSYCVTSWFGTYLFGAFRPVPGTGMEKTLTRVLHSHGSLEDCRVQVHEQSMTESEVDLSALELRLLMLYERSGRTRSGVPVDRPGMSLCAEDDAVLAAWEDMAVLALDTDLAGDVREEAAHLVHRVSCRNLWLMQRAKDLGVPTASDPEHRAS